MYAKIDNGEVVQYPYSLQELIKSNPSTSFPSNFTPEILALFGVYEVVSVDTPPYDEVMQNIQELPIEYINGAWTQVWQVSDASSNEIAERTYAIESQKEHMRLAAYRDEADPLFFKYQRGELDKQVWLDKVAEIKNRYI